MRRQSREYPSAAKCVSPMNAGTTAAGYLDLAAEIVDMLEIPEGTVKSRINRGRIELAKILKRMRVVTV